MKLGSVVAGVVEKVTPFGVIVYVNAKGYMKGTISTEHLADHHGIDIFLVWILSLALFLFARCQ